MNAKQSPGVLHMSKKDLVVLKRDLAKASRRMGDSAKWLLDFAYRDLSAMDPNAAIDIGAQTLAFAVQEYDPPAESDEFDKFDKVDDLWSWLWPWISNNGKIEGSLIELFQRDLRKRFDDCKVGRWWKYQRPGVEECFTIIGDRRSPEGGFYSDDTYSLPPPIDILLDAATTVVKRERERFAVCRNPRCEKMFVSERKRRGKFCSAKCSAYVRVNKARGITIEHAKRS